MYICFLTIYVFPTLHSHTYRYVCVFDFVIETYVLNQFKWQYSIQLALFSLTHNQGWLYACPSQWEKALRCNGVSFWQGVSLESALHNDCCFTLDAETDVIYGLPNTFKFYPLYVYNLGKCMYVVCNFEAKWQPNHYEKNILRNIWSLARACTI